MLHISTYTIIQNIMKTFHKAMKIRKYLRLSKNSLILSPKNQEENKLRCEKYLIHWQVTFSTLLEKQKERKNTKS